MQLSNQHIIEAAGRVIIFSGTQSLTIDSLAKELELDIVELSSHVHNEEKVFELLLLHLEIELKALRDEVSSKKDLPSLELGMFFKKLHALFNQKPYYLMVIFDDDLHQGYKRIQVIILEIERIAKGYLTDLINRGKEEKVFSSIVSTKVLVDNILGSFQSLMNDSQIADKMIQDLKKI
ncbi:MAG: hypothetical protein WC967_10810 [Balneolaceae bacterium]